ncbi:MAG: sensor histidine kinase [Actinomycetota bacterium]
MSQASRRRNETKGITWDRWAILWGAFFYVILAYALFSALYHGSHSTPRVALILFLATALGIWHGYRLLARINPPSDVVYSLGAAALWVGLNAVEPDFIILGLGIFAPLCLQDVRWAGVAAVIVGGWVWQQWAQQGSIPWRAVLSVSIFLAFSLLAVGYVSTIVRQSQERQRLIDQLHDAQSELAEAERQAGVLEERQRLARDIHDTLTQGFASIVMLLQAAEESLGQDHPAGRHVARALQSARDNLAESRRLVWALRPEALADTPLPAALERLARQLSEDTGIRAATVVTGNVRSLDTEQETVLLRVVQESLANVRKHARATGVTVTLSYMNDIMVLDIQDDGVGFTPPLELEAAQDGGLGLRAMRERVAEIGGTVSVESAPGAGTTVVAHLPADQNHPVEASRAEDTRRV